MGQEAVQFTYLFRWLGWVGVVGEVRYKANLSKIELEVEVEAALGKREKHVFL